MAAQRIPLISPGDYLKQEREAEFRSEYYGGEVFAMSGASEAHNTINYNLALALGPARRNGQCRVYQNDMRVAVRNGQRFVYPDTIVVCGERLFYDAELDTLLNPTVIVEVLSPSTERFDRGEKFIYYQQIPSLMEYVLVSQTPCGIEIFRRDGEEWRYSRVDDCAATVTLHSIGVALALSDVYQSVDRNP